MTLTPLQINLALMSFGGLSALLSCLNVIAYRSSESQHSRSHYRTQAILDGLISASLFGIVLL